MNFKFIVSKNQQRYDLIIKANSEIEARDRLHNEGYSILNVEQIENLEILGNKFLFSVEKDSEIKTGIIYWEDIFKVYLKLKKEFDYNVVSLFNEQDKEKSDDYKKNTLKKIEEEYYLFSNKWVKKELEEQKEIVKIQNKQNILEQDFYLKKELEEVYKLTDFVLKKLQNIINSAYFEIEIEQKEKLVFIYNSLIALKNSRNINKLREIIELALIKIWKLELEYLEKTKDKKLTFLLKETNTLLKNAWSKTQIIEKDKDIIYILKQKYNVLMWLFKDFKTDDNVKQDKETHSYIKTLVLLKKYKEKKEEVDKEYKKYTFNFFSKKENKESLLLKKLVINQNISILEAKIKGKIFSYTKVIKWYRTIENYFLKCLNIFVEHLIVIIFVYCLLFLLFILLSNFSIININISMSWVIIFIYLLFLLLLFNLSRGFMSFSFYFVIFIFLNIFFTVNF